MSDLRDAYAAGAAVMLNKEIEKVTREERYTFKLVFFECLRLRLDDPEFREQMRKDIETAEKK